MPIVQNQQPQGNPMQTGGGYAPSPPMQALTAAGAASGAAAQPQMPLSGNISGTQHGGTVHDPRYDNQGGHQSGAPSMYGFSGYTYQPGGYYAGSNGGGFEDTGMGTNDPAYNWGGYGSGQAPGGPTAGGQQTLQPGGFAMPNMQEGYWTPGEAFDDPNAAGIYGVINNQINNRANWQATMLGQAQNFYGAQIGPVSGAQAAQIAPQMMVGGAQLNTGSDLAYQAAQNAGINQLANQAAGMGPSVAEVQAKQQAQQNIAAMNAALGSQRGAGSAALGMRQAADQASAANQQAAATGALGRSQEAMAASQQLQAALGAARGQTQATSQTQAQLDQQALLASQGAFNNASLQQAQLGQNAGQFNASQYNQQALQQAGLNQAAGLANQSAQNQFWLQNQQAALQAQQMGNQAYTQGLAAYMGQNQQDIQNSIAYQQMLRDEQLQKYAIDQGVAINTMNNVVGAAGAGASAFGALGAGLLAAPSDARLKTEIRSGDADLIEFLEALS